MRKGRPLEDLTGKTFDLLTVEELAPRRSGHTYWWCRCECGNRVTRQPGHLQNGNQQSCGCKRARKYNSVAHRNYSRLAAIYGSMVNRCTNDEDARFPDYGGRGIRVCLEWLRDREAFIDWALQNDYANNLTLDRRDNDQGYSPENCRWATAAEQARNRRSTVIDQDRADAIKALLAMNVPPSLIAKAGGYRRHIVNNIKNNGAWS